MSALNASSSAVMFSVTSAGGVCIHSSSSCPNAPPSCGSHAEGSVSQPPILLSIASVRSVQDVSRTFSVSASPWTSSSSNNRSNRNKRRLQVQAQKDGPSSIRTVPVQVAHELINAGHHYLDVRTPEEFAAGHVEGSINIPYMVKMGPGMIKNVKFVEEVSQEFDRDDEIIVACQSGRRSMMAVAELRAVNFSAVTDMGGGYSAWKESGLPLQTQRSQQARQAFDAGSNGVGSNGVLVEDYEELLQGKADKIKDELNGTCIFLIGMMGSGKTTVGRVLSKSLGYYFFDSDELVEQAAGGTSVAQIFEESDEEGFRKAETEVLRQLSALGRLVVATGGGAVIEPHNWGYLRHGIVVWLDVPLDALAKRVTSVGTESRPLLPPDAAQHQALARLSKLLEQRGAAYAHADATVSIQALAVELGIVEYFKITPTMITLQVLEEIEKLLIEKKRKMPIVSY